MAPSAGVSCPVCSAVGVGTTFDGPVADDEEDDTTSDDEDDDGVDVEDTAAEDDDVVDGCVASVSSL